MFIPALTSREPREIEQPFLAYPMHKYVQLVQVPVQVNLACYSVYMPIPGKPNWLF